MGQGFQIKKGIIWRETHVALWSVSAKENKQMLKSQHGCWGGDSLGVRNMDCLFLIFDLAMSVLQNRISL